ncbi:MAG: SDR family NAD(P)-dependent oxidoreductase [Bacteroidota bacterium]
MQSIQGKKALIVGATGGIGQETSKLLKQSGANLWVAGRNQEKLQALQAQLSLPDDQVLSVDLEDPSSIEQMLAAVLADGKAPDIYINAAGIGIIQPIEQLELSSFQRLIQINLIASYQLLHGLLPAMKATKQGLIIHIPGVLGKAPMAGASAYAASKYGLNGMIKSLREEVKRTEIRFTNLYLGGVDSAFWDNIDLRVQRNRMILATEAARSVWFLCQQPSSGVVAELVVQPFNHQVL